MRRRLFGITAVARMLSGCTPDTEWLRRQEAVESTIGHDPSKATAGKVISPPGMGVDLGQRTLTSHASVLA